MKRYIVIFILISFSLSAYTKNFLKDELKSSGFRCLVELGAGGNYYRSTGLYKTDQWVFDGSATLGYQINKTLFVGIGGAVRRCMEDYMTSFPGFVSSRITLQNVRIKPYVEARGGMVVYPKWNDQVKHYFAVGTGIHILPRLSAGVRVSNFGTLDNRHSWETSLCMSFTIGG